MLGGLESTGLGLSDSAVTDNMNAGRFDGDFPGIGAIITAVYMREAVNLKENNNYLNIYNIYTKSSASN